MQIGKCAAQPPLRNHRKSANLGCFFDHFLELNLGTDHYHDFILRHDLSDSLKSRLKKTCGLVKINNKNSIAHPGKIGFHLGVDIWFFVAKLQSGFGLSSTEIWMLIVYELL